MSRQQLATLGLGIGSILSSDVAQFRGLIGAGMQLAFLKFSRDDERESDVLGLRYMTEVGYDPREMPDVFRMLSRASGGEGSGSPEWLSTHPNPENREARIEELIADLDANPETMTVDRDEYLRRLDGVVDGPDPRNGYFRGSTFVHPEMRFRFSFPGGWQTVNKARAVVGQPEGGDAIMALTLAEEGSAEEGPRALLSRKGLEAGPTERRAINGHGSAWGRFRARTEQAVLMGTVAFVEYGGRVFQMMGYTTEDRYGSYRNAFQESFFTFDEVSDPSLLNVEPKRVRIVRLPGAMTL